MQSRVFITAAGVSCPIGTGVEEVMNSIELGVPGCAELSVFDASAFPTRFAAESRRNGHVIHGNTGEDRKAMLLNIALTDLISKNGTFSSQTPISIGTGIDHFDFPGFAECPSHLPERWRQFNHHSCQVAKKVASQFDLFGESIVNVSACVASSQAMGIAFRMVRSGYASTVITGGFDSMLSHLHYMGFYKLGALSSWQGSATEACRPFDKNRCGIVLGEGAAVFSFTSETEIGTKSVLAEVVGYASTMDAYLVTDPEPEGRILAQAIELALKDAQLQPNDIDCVHLHGTGTIKNDLAETKALELVFGKTYTEIPVFSLKGQIGHLIGACGAVETIGVLYSLQKQLVPITVNSNTPDPLINLMVARSHPIHKPIRHILKLNAAFGGQNTALIFKRYD